MKETEKVTALISLELKIPKSSAPKYSSQVFDLISKDDSLAKGIADLLDSAIKLSGVGVTWDGVFRVSYNEGVDRVLKKLEEEIDASILNTPKFENSEGYSTTYLMDIRDRYLKMR